MQPAPVISQQQATGVQQQATGVHQQNSYIMQTAPILSQQQPTPNAATSEGGRCVLTNSQCMFVGSAELLGDPDGISEKGWQSKNRKPISESNVA